MRPVSIAKTGRWGRFDNGVDVEVFDSGADGRSVGGTLWCCHGAASGAGSRGASSAHLLGSLPDTCAFR